MPSGFLAPIQSTIKCALCAWCLVSFIGVTAAQPPPGGGAQAGQPKLPASLPPELQKVSEEYARANKLYAARQYAEARTAYKEFVRLAIGVKLNTTPILSAYSTIAIIDHLLGDNKDYAETLHKIIDMDPKNAAAFAQLALIDSMEHDLGAAEMYANKALALKPPKNVESTVHFVKGNAAVARKDFVAAAQEFGEAASLLPTNTMAHFNCGLALAELKRYSDAQKELEAAHKLDPKNPRINEYLGKLKTYLAALKAQPTSPTAATKFDADIQKDPHNGRALLGRARELEKKGRTSDAETAYVQALQVVPDSFEGHFNLAHLYLNDKKYISSREQYKSAQQVAAKAGSVENGARAYGGLAAAEMQEGMSLPDYRERTQAFAGAETHVKQAIDMDPKEADFKILLGRIYAEQSRFKDAGDLYRKMLEGSPNDVSLYVRLANTYKALRDLNGVVKVWKEYQALKPEDPTSYEYITEIYNQFGKYQEAADTVKEMLKRDLTNSVKADATVVLGQDLIELKNVEEARSDFKKVLGMTPSQVPASFMLGEKAALEAAQRLALKALAGEAAKENKFDEAIGYLNELKKREAEIYRSSGQPPDGEVYKNIAVLYERSKRIDKAMAEYQDMARVVPADPVPHEEMGRMLDEQKKIDAAAAEYTRASKLNKKDAVQDLMKISDMYQRNGLLDKAVTELEALRDKNPSKVEVLTALALLYRRTKQDEKALKIYDEIIKTNPSQGWVQDARAQCMINLHRYADAETVFVEEITRNPKAGRQTYADLARDYALQGKADKFLEFMKPRFERDPTNSTAMAVVYDAYAEEQKETEGQAYIVSVIEKSGVSRRTCLQEYATLLQINKHKPESLEIYKRVARENPTDVSAQVSLAEQLDFNGFKDEANQIYADLIARPGSKPDELYNLRYRLATRYFQQHKLPEARAIFQTMFNNNNKNFDVAMRLGDLIEKTGTPSDAIAFYKGLLGIQTYILMVRVDIRNRLGNLYEAVNKLDDAVSQFTEALKLDPDNAIANAQLKKLQTKPAPAPTH